MWLHEVVSSHGCEDKPHTLKVMETPPAPEGSVLSSWLVFIFSTCLMLFFILYLLHCCDLLAII